MNTQHTLLDLFNSAQENFSDRAAFTCLGHTLTYGDIDKLSAAFAAYLQQNTNLQAGDRIAIQLPNLLQYPVAIYGAMRAGLIIVNTNPLYTPRELQHQFSDSGAKALLTSTLTLPGVNSIIENTPVETVFVTGILDLHPETIAASQDEPLPPETSERIRYHAFRQVLAKGNGQKPETPPCSAEDIAVLQYTGGTTGVAKGAMLTHRNLVANTQQITEHSSAYFSVAGLTYAAPLPLYHIYAFSLHCIAILTRGGHSLLIPNPRDPDSVVDALKAHPFTGFVGINTLFNTLCHHDGFQQLDFSHLKSSSAGGMALSPDVAEKWQSLTGIEISEGYGMTEASPVISANPPGRNQPGTIGLPVPNTEVKVIDSEGHTLAAGEAGELCVRGPQVMKGYWQLPEATAEVISEDGWLRTGDIAVIQEDGYIRLLDRLKDMIVVSGFNVYPTELEDVANAHPEVLESAAIGVPDERSGEAVKLFVVPEQEGIDLDALKAYMRENLAAYKAPSTIELVSDLPKSNVGKILRKDLRQ